MSAEPAHQPHEEATYDTKHCPKCRGRLFRTWRRPIDRLTSLVVPVKRFRCEYFACQWEGNFPARHQDFVSTEAQFALLETSRDERASSSLPWSFVVSTSLLLAVFITCVVFITTDIPFYEQLAVRTDQSGIALSVTPAQDPVAVTQPSLAVARK